MQQEETHPWKWFAPANSRVLIVGTFPPATKNWSFDFFYPNKQNLFWKIMASIAEVELEHFVGEAAVNERKRVMQLLNVAITDMGYKIVRNDNSSLDEKLEIVEYMDIWQMLDECPTINKVLFTSSSGLVSASGWFNDYLKLKDIIHKFPAGLRPRRSELRFKDRMIELGILYSPSKRAANRISFQQLVELYKNEIKTTKASN